MAVSVLSKESRLEVKDPDAVDDYPIDWSDTLPSGDTISTSNWTKTGDVTLGSESNTTTTATTFVSGGTVGAQAQITNRIVTAGGRTYDKTITLLIAEQ